jgi:hypothetical protein
VTHLGGSTSASTAAQQQQQQQQQQQLHQQSQSSGSASALGLQGLGGSASNVSGGNPTGGGPVLAGAAMPGGAGYAYGYQHYPPNARMASGTSKSGTSLPSMSSMMMMGPWGMGGGGGVMPLYTGPVFSIAANQSIGGGVPEQVAGLVETCTFDHVAFQVLAQKYEIGSGGRNSYFAKFNNDDAPGNGDGGFGQSKQKKKRVDVRELQKELWDVCGKNSEAALTVQFHRSAQTWRFLQVLLCSGLLESHETEEEEEEDLIVPTPLPKDAMMTPPKLSEIKTVKEDDTPRTPKGGLTFISFKFIYVLIFAILFFLL